MSVYFLLLQFVSITVIVSIAKNLNHKVIHSAHKQKKWYEGSLGDDGIEVKRLYL